MTGAVDSERRARLLAAKLSAIVRAHGHDGASNELRPGSFGPGAGLVAGDRAWVLVDEPRDDGTGLGGALAWARRQGAAGLELVADVPLTVASRRAAEFAYPIRVWSVSGRDLQPVAPAAVAVPPAASPEHLGLAADIESAGAAVVVEHGVVAGEVRGLEVCRVVGDEGNVRLEVGVGPQDRDAFAIIHGDVPTAAALAGVVATVDNARRLDAPGHPLNRLVPERLLRWRLEQEPWLAGVDVVRPAEPPVPRPGLKQRMPCSATGLRPDGSPAVIVCSVGVDLDVVPYAADARLAAASAGGQLPDTVVVMPARDLLPITAELAGALHRPVELVALPDA